jgi:prepilin-type N-terminal cleavage/methylation domain-containing protein
MTTARRRGLTLMELLVSMAIFSVVTGFMVLLYNNLSASIRFSTARMDARGRIRVAMERIVPILSGAYTPNEIPGAVRPFELITNPSILKFYTPGDPFEGSPIQPPTDLSSPTAGTYLVSNFLQLELDSSSRLDTQAGGGPSRVLKKVVLRKLVTPTTLPVASPTVDTTVSPRLLATDLSEMTIANVTGNTGVQLTLSAQDFSSTQSRKHTITTATVSTRVTFVTSTF